MGVHDFHPSLEGYDPEQIWFDGCEECEWRSRNTDRGITSLDSNNRIKAVSRALLWETDDGLVNASQCEVRLFNAVLHWYYFFSRAGLMKAEEL